MHFQIHKQLSSLLLIYSCLQQDMERHNHCSDVDDIFPLCQQGLRRVGVATCEKTGVHQAENRGHSQLQIILGIQSKINGFANIVLHLFLINLRLTNHHS